MSSRPSPHGDGGDGGDAHPPLAAKIRFAMLIEVKIAQYILK